MAGDQSSGGGLMSIADVGVEHIRLWQSRAAEILMISGPRPRGGLN